MTWLQWKDFQWKYKIIPILKRISEIQSTINMPREFKELLKMRREKESLEKYLENELLERKLSYMSYQPFI